MGENNKHLVINQNQILDQNQNLVNNINNNKYLEINNELCNIIIHNMNSINDYDINKILQLKEKTDYIIIFDSMVNALNPNNLYVNYKYNTCSIVFEYIIKIMMKLEKKNMLLNLNNSIHFFNTLIILDKCQYFLEKISKHINYSTFSKHKYEEIIIEICKKGTFPGYLFFRNKVIINENNIFELLVNSVKNNDMRILEYIIKKEKFNNFVFQEPEINNILSSLFNISSSKRFLYNKIRLLSEKIDLVNNFHCIINYIKQLYNFIDLEKYYYKSELSYYSILRLYQLCMINDDVTSIHNKLKSNNEKQLLLIIDLLSKNYLENKIIIDSNLEKVIIKEYTHIIRLLSILYNYEYDNVYINNIYKILRKNNLFQKYILEVQYVEASKLFFYTRFYCRNQNEYGFGMNLLCNKVMHKLRCLMKRRYNKHLNHIKLELGPIIYEIKNLSSKKQVVKQSNNIKSKFTLLPPRHILPVELLTLENVLIKEKSDGIQVNTLSMFDEFSNCQIKAEYIEEHEIYLVFDIDLPNTSIKERINYLRLLHPFTKKLNNFQEINTVNDLITNIDYERKNLITYLSQNENKVKWYPKASFCIKKMTDELLSYFNNYVEKSSNYVNIEGPIKNDGFIVTKTDVEYQELKIKSKDLLTIDLLFDGFKFIDQDNIVWSNMIINNKKYQKNKIYRCYPVNYSVNGPINDQFEAREMRFDKKKPNTNKICDNVVNLIKYDWLKPCEKPNNYYYFNKNVTMNKKDIKSIDSNNNFLLNIISELELNNNLNWLDLGCGKGKYIESIKKYNPKKYLGMDADMMCLLKGYNKYNSEQTYNFYQCDLGKEWHETEYKYFTFNWQQKYDIVLCNFSIMHFNTEIFWNQLNLITKPNSIMIVNTVKPNKEFKNGNSYLKSFENECKYYFDWVHKTEQTELLVDFNNINNWKIIKTFENNFDDLTKCYKWYILRKI
jgi:ubiquinone/menaquinone biosynthesis C-methylase UbiE